MYNMYIKNILILIYHIFIIIYTKNDFVEEKKIYICFISS